MSAYRLYGASTASGDAVAAIDVRDNGIITGVWLLRTGVGSDAIGLVEVSFAPTRSGATNDTTQVIGSLTYADSGTSSEQAYNGSAEMRVKVTAGDRIYLHHTIYQGTVAASHLLAHVYVQDSVSGKTSSQRR